MQLDAKPKFSSLLKLPDKIGHLRTFPISQCDILKLENYLHEMKVIITHRAINTCSNFTRHSLHIMP